MSGINGAEPIRNKKSTGPEKNSAMVEIKTSRNSSRQYLSNLFQKRSPGSRTGVGSVQGVELGVLGWGKG